VNAKHPSCHWTLCRSVVIDKLNRKEKDQMPHAGRAQDGNTEFSFVYLVKGSTNSKRQDVIAIVPPPGLYQ
jgi:hypothetical protein